MNKILSLPEPLLPGVPSAPKGKRFITAAEIDYQKRKRQLAHRLPALKPEDLIGALDQPFYQALLHELMASGNSKVADEINNLLRKEERDRKSSHVKTRMSPEKLINQPEVLQRIANTLKLEETLLQEGKKESAMLICKHLADEFLLQDRNVWLARHFYLAVLSRCRKICPTTTTRLQAEIHCLLAYLAREHNENLDVYEIVDACTMSLYMIASLLEHELLISLANQIMHSPHHKAPTDDDLKNAHEFADLALQLALEVRQPVALSSALTRFGIVLRHVGAFDDAMKYFQQLQQHANLIGDIATEAIAFHNMGLCYIGMVNTVNALECFAKQKELADLIVTKELEGHSMHEIGHLLLQEGHLWEAEESYLLAFENYYYAKEARKSLKETRKSVDHGQAGRTGSGQARDMKSVLEFKCGRKPLKAVGRPDYAVQDISKLPKPWEALMNNVLSSKQMDEDAVFSWEEGFMFASNKRASRERRRARRKVGFDQSILDTAYHSESEKSSPPISIEAALAEIRELTNEADNDRKKQLEYNASRASQLLEKDKARRSIAQKARASRVSRTSFSTPMNSQDRRQTIGGSEPGGNEAPTEEVQQ